MAIKVNKIEPYTCEAFDPQDNSLGFLNEYEFNDLRIQIRKAEAEGYYMKREDGEICVINSKGKLANWPRGFYDTTEYQLMELI